MVDHYMIYGIRKKNGFKIKSPKMQRITETCSLKRYNKALFQQDMREIDWDNALNPLANDPSKIVATFLEVFESLMNAHELLKGKKLRNDFAPWLTHSVRDR